MQTKVRSNSVITTGLVNGVLVFTVKGAGEAGADAVMTLDPSALSAQVRERAMLHGLVQRVQDAAAMSRDTTSGRPASPQEKFEAMQRLVDHYGSGSEEWSPARTGGGGGSEGYLLRALLKLRSDVDAGKVREFYKRLDRKQRAALSESSEIRQIIDRLRSAQGPKVDVSGLMDELDTLE